MAEHAVTLKQLETFIAVAEESSFRLASERLHRSQPAVTAHVQALEAHLGVPLLHRTTRSVRLSQAGSLLLREARGTLAGLDALIRDFRAQKDLRQGRVVIGASPSCVASILPGVIAEFQDLAPNITIEIREAYAKGLLEKLLADDVELAIGPSDSSMTEFDFHLLRVDPYGVVMAPDYRLSSRGGLDLGDILDEPIIVMPRESAAFKEIENAFKAAGRVLLPRFVLSHHQGLFAMVAAGLGVTVMPFIAVPPLGFHIAPLLRPAISRDVGIITRKGQGLTPAAREFMKVLRRHSDQGVFEKDLDSTISLEC